MINFFIDGIFKTVAKLKLTGAYLLIIKFSAN